MGARAITAQALIDGAIGRTGLDDLGSRHFEEYLEAWCSDLSSGRLSERGQAFLARQASRNIELRLGILDTIRRNPEIEDVRLPPIVRIMGFPRAGTTFLHNLVSLHPSARALLRWELVHPLPPPEAATYATDQRIEQTNRALTPLRGTEIERLHWVEATDPEECTCGFFDISGMLARGFTSVMQDWTDIVIDLNTVHRETYEEYRQLIKLLLWRNPLPSGGVLVLKCPTDNDQIRAFLDVFPEAKLILCHRDPFRALISGCRTQEVIVGAQLASPDAVDIGAGDGRLLEVFRRFAAGMVAAVADDADRIASVRYADLMADPARTVGTAFDQLAIPADADGLGRAIEDFIAAQRQGRRAAPPPDYDTFGYSAADIRSDPSMAAYIEAFDVPSEDVRVSAPVVKKPTSL